MRIVLIPGWNEGAADMQVFVDGRYGKPGLRASGFECATFGGGSGSATERIDQLAAFVNGVRAADATGEPIGLFGYSAGGLFARGLLRNHPDVAIASVFQLAVPNAGIVSDDAAALLHRIHFSRSLIADLDLESDFVRWLNGTSGRWITDGESGAKRWKLDKKPWVSPENVPLVNLVGRVPRYKNISDGVVLVDSATLDGHAPHEFVDGKGANHLNLSGTWNPLTFVLRGWRNDDRYWPRAVERAAEFFKSHVAR